MKTYKIYYHDREIHFEADDLQFSDSYALFLKDGIRIAYIPKSCPFTVIGIKPNDNEK